VAKIDSFSTLKTAIEGLLFRTDLDTELFIQLCEARLSDDHRAYSITEIQPEITGHEVTLPADYHALQSWRITGDGFSRPLEVGSDIVSSLYPTDYTGIPEYVALVPPLARLYPTPDGTYQSRMTYRRIILPLSDTQTTNWLLEERPDIYLYGSAVHAAPQIKDDQRVALWENLYSTALDERYRATKHGQFGGPIRRFVEAID